MEYTATCPSVAARHPTNPYQWISMNMKQYQNLLNTKSIHKIGNNMCSVSILTQLNSKSCANTFYSIHMIKIIPLYGSPAPEGSMHNIKEKTTHMWWIIELSHWQMNPVLQRLSDATDSAENKYRTRERTESWVGSYGWSLDGISRIAGIGLL